eukprot:CAMPEP_0181293374 /NCGR_PEP_ID=MMETSP1101-20121128/3032_1 /TAXON_ID=46948 /ORGANISM="Rhodomonas abbreviata, Strain Caron Lab Isolate" /LENGTH=191 /DNA_ID=CAMNT_0023397959 /DNA_START=523 /DNA_END=1098 /DNA_ORIENTATION=-
MASTIPKRFHSDLRFIVVVREPIARDLSWWKMIRSENANGRRLELNVSANYTDFVLSNLNKSLTQQHAKNPLHVGLFVQHLETLWAHFNRAQTMVLSFDTLHANFTDSIRRIASFLGVDFQPWEKKSKGEITGRRAKSVPQTDIDPEPCRLLKAFFLPYNTRFYELMSMPGSPPEQPQFPPFADPCPTSLQ